MTAALSLALWLASAHQDLSRVKASREDAPTVNRFKSGSTPRPSTMQPVRVTWYGREFQGKRTASGQRYDVRKMTAAHRTLPFGTRIKVCRVATGKCIVAVVNDRGIGKRFEADLTPAAFSRLARLRAGVIAVRIEVLK